MSSVNIRTDLQAGDLGYITYLHGLLYSREYGYAIAFESYVAKGLHEFYTAYNPLRNRIWIVEENNKIVGSLLLMDRGEEAQLRYFLIDPEYRGQGLGKKMMELFMDFLKDCNYSSCYLWTTHELEGAASLYKRYGFILSEEKLSHAFGKELMEQKYVLTLPQTNG